MSLLRIVAGVTALPFSAMGAGLQGWLSGPQAILDVTVKAIDETMARQLLLTRLRRAGSDDNVAGVLLRLHGAPGGWAACQDLRNTISALRASGRAVYAFIEEPSNQLMWIGAACDRIAIPPLTQVGLVGVGVELTFFGAALHRMGVAPDFEAAGAYKSFGETFTRSFASPANHEAVQHLVSDLQSQLLADIAGGRGRSTDELDAVLARAPLSAEEALEAGLVDQLVYQDQLEDWLMEHHGNSARLVAFGAWARRDAALEWLDGWGSSGTVLTVVHLEGPIGMDEVPGKPNIAARSVVPLLKRLREDDNVGAVVLHVNSPGGSALASDLIWREVAQLQEKKPVVASFEDVAASGGYYLSAPAVEIVARSSTLTGSIGVFGGKLVAGEGLRKVGVHAQEVSAAPNANLFSPSRPFTDAQRARFRESLERFYAEFVKRVADGRKRSEEALEPHCRGRVWTGQAARERGLVDRDGDLFDAVDRARALAGLHPASYVRRDVPTFQQSWVQKRLNQAVRDVMPSAAQAVLARVTEPMLELLARHQGEVMAMLPFTLRIR